MGKLRINRGLSTVKQSKSSFISMAHKQPIIGRKVYTVALRPLVQSSQSKLCKNLNIILKKNEKAFLTYTISNSVRGVS